MHTRKAKQRAVRNAPRGWRQRWRRYSERSAADRNGNALVVISLPGMKTVEVSHAAATVLVTNLADAGQQGQRTSSRRAKSVDATPAIHRKCGIFSNCLCGVITHSFVFRSLKGLQTTECPQDCKMGRACPQDCKPRKVGRGHRPQRIRQQPQRLRKQSSLVEVQNARLFYCSSQPP